MYFGRSAASLEISQRAFQQIDAKAFTVERNAHCRDVEAVETRQRSAIGLLFDKNRIARLQQNPVDQIEGLERARRQQDVLALAKQSGITLQLNARNSAQPPMALRTTCQTVGCERAAFPLERGRCRDDEVIDRNRIRVVIAPGEIVVGPSPST